jgi:hypothetical protein
MRAKRAKSRAFMRDEGTPAGQARASGLARRQQWPPRSSAGLRSVSAARHRSLACSDRYRPLPRHANVTRCPLPAHATALGDQLQMLVALGRRGLCRCAWHRTRTRRHNDRRIRMTLADLTVDIVAIVRYSPRICPPRPAGSSCLVREPSRRYACCGSRYEARARSFQPPSCCSGGAAALVDRPGLAPPACFSVRAHGPTGATERSALSRRAADSPVERTGFEPLVALLTMSGCGSCCRRSPYGRSPRSAPRAASPAFA